MTNTEYVAGFCFSKDLQSVLLCRKAKPAWQKGKLNGIGGKVGGIYNMITKELLVPELPLTAMVREFYEEAGIATKQTDWTKFCTLCCESAVVHFYAWQSPYERMLDLAQFNGWAKDANITHPEYITCYSINSFQSEAIPNLSWLVPMALNRLKNLETSLVVLETF